MALEFTKLSEVENIETPVAEATVIVEDSGSIKRTPMKNIGKVKSINGAEPDENGNVEVEIPEGFSGSWNDLTDRPFEIIKEQVTLTDNAEFDIQEYDWGYDSQTAYFPATNYIEFEEGMVIHVVYNSELGTIECDCIVNSRKEISIAVNESPTDNLFVTNFKYENCYQVKRYGSSIGEGTISMYIKGEAKPLDEIYIPNTIARISDIPEIPEIPEQVQADLSETDFPNKAYVHGVLQPRHLPDGYPYKVAEVEGIIFEEKTLELQDYDAGTIKTRTLKKNNTYIIDDLGSRLRDVLIGGATYRVTMDGVEYICTPRNDAGFGWTLGEYDSADLQRLTNIAYPFVLSDAFYFATEADTVTLKIEKGTFEFKTIDEKYIPDSLKQSPNLSETDSTSKTYVDGVVQQRHLPDGYPYEETVKNVIWERDVIDIKNTTLYGNMSSMKPLLFVVDGVEYELTPKEAPYVHPNGNIIGEWGYYVGKISMHPDYASAGLVDDDVPFYICVRDFDQSPGGLYHLTVDSQDKKYQLCNVRTTIVPIAEKFLPPEIVNVLTVVLYAEGTGNPASASHSLEEITNAINSGVIVNFVEHIVVNGRLTRTGGLFIKSIDEETGYITVDGGGGLNMNYYVIMSSGVSATGK